MAKLLGRADTTLVKAATDAAMANVPKDLSRIHERMSKSRAQAMQSIGNAWVQGIGVAMKVGQKLVEQAKKFNAAADLTDSYNEATKPRVLEEGETLTFDDKKTKKWSSELDVLKQKATEMKEWTYKGTAAGFTPKDQKTNFEEQKKLEDKIAKRNTKLKSKDSSTRIYTDSNGGEEIVEPRTVKGQLKNIRKEIADLRLDKGDLTNEQRKDKIDKLRIKKDNLRSSVVGFRAKLEVVTEQLKLGNIDTLASSMGENGSLNMQFTHALIAGGKPLGEDAKYTDGDGNVISLAGARAQVGFTDEEGKMAFTFTDEYGRPLLKDDGSEMSIQIDDVQDLIIPKNPAIIEGYPFVTAKKTHFDSGYNNPTVAYDPSQTNNFIDTTVTDKNSYLSAINHSSGDMKMSLVSALNGVTYDDNGNPVLGSTEMSDFFWEELEALGLGLEYDISGDGKVSKEDFSEDTINSDDALKDDDNRVFWNEDGYFNKESGVALFGDDNFKKLRDEVLSGKDLNLGRQLLKANTNAQNEKHHADGVEKFKNKPKPRTGTGTGTPKAQITLFGQTFDAPEEFGNSRARMQTELSNVTKIMKGEGVTIGNQVFAWDPETFKYKQTYTTFENKVDEATDFPERFTQKELIGRASSYYGVVPGKFEGFGKAEAESTRIAEETAVKLAEEQKIAQEAEAGRMKVIEGLFGNDADEDDAIIKLKTEYPELMGKGKIYVKTEGKDKIFIKLGDELHEFNLKGTKRSTPEMEMQRLKNLLKQKPE